MNRTEFTYSFKAIASCNMCGEAVANHKVLGKRMNRSQGKNPKNRTGITTTVLRCNACDLIYSNPQPIPASIQDHYGVPPEDYWKESYFTVNENYFQHEINVLKKLQEFQPGMKALDIGAGLGKGMIALERAGYETYGFEPSEPFHDRAINKMGISAERLKLGMLEEVDYPENTFDFISFGAVLEHLYDPSASIVKALSWLKPGGLIQIEVPSSHWLINRLVNFYYRLRRSDYVANLSPMHEPYHLYEFDLKSFEQHAQKHGYEIASHTYFVADTYLPKSLDWLLKPWMRRTNTGMQLSIWLRKTS